MSDRFVTETANRIHLASAQLSRLVRQDDGAGLSAARLSALNTIAAEESLTLNELSAREQVRPPTMSRIVDALVRDGLIGRTADLFDRRAINITITEAGRAALEHSSRQRIDMLAPRLLPLPEYERRALERGLEVLEKVLRG